ncbi:hypothetical protein HG531_002842 [Fusarium graminearum]|nr:hypothetical protein HG531_002842 [Fusarium graminearum]
MPFLKDVFFKWDQCRHDLFVVQLAKADILSNEVIATSVHQCFFVGLGVFLNVVTVFGFRESIKEEPVGSVQWTLLLANSPHFISDLAVNAVGSDDNVSIKRIAILGVNSGSTIDEVDTSDSFIGQNPIFVLDIVVKNL